MSESIHSGFLPLWNPYINYGIPQYGDMSSGFWSPITWLIAASVGYNAYTFTIEVIAYLFIGAIGMYKLSSHFNLVNKVRFIAAVTFMCCGYNVGHMQHFNWLSGAAFLPWCVWSYILLYKYFSIKSVLISALLFYLFLSAAHPGLIIGALYFFISLSFYLFIKNDKQLSFYHSIKKFALANAILIIMILLVSAGMVIGYLDILPYFSRGEKLALAGALKDPTTVQSWVSFLFPLSTTKNDHFFATDVSMRNVYMGITLFFFFFISFFKQKSSWQKFFLFTGVAFFLLSAGGVFKIAAYKFIPLISYVRLNGEFVIFSLLCFIIVAAIELNNFIIERKNFKSIQLFYYLFEIVIIAAIAFGLYKTFSTHQSFLYIFKNISAQNGVVQKLKGLIDAITFFDALWLQGLIQLLLLWGIKWCLRERDFNLLIKIVIADMILATLLNLPFTGVGKASVADVQRVLNKSPKGIPIPKLQPVIKNDTVSLDEKGLVGDWSFYNKQIGVVHQAPYPILLKNINQYLDGIETNSTVNFTKNNFLFLTDVNAAEPLITFFSSNKIKVNVISNDSGKIVYQQAFYPHWFYSNGKEKKEVAPYASTFISVPLNKGENQVEFLFEPRKVKAAMLISLIVFISICILLLLNPPLLRRSLFLS